MMDLQLDKEHIPLGQQATVSINHMMLYIGVVTYITTVLSIPTTIAAKPHV